MMYLNETATGSTLVEGVAGIFDVLGSGAEFIVKDIFVDLIIGQVFTQPIVWVGTAIGVGIALFSRFKKPLK